MDFTKKRRIQVNTELFEKYPHDLQMYTDPPDMQITLVEFEELAIERLRVLRILEMVSLKGGAKYFDEWRTAVINNLNEQGLKTYRKLIEYGSDKTKDDNNKNVYEIRQRDHVSHFILRLAYCQSEEYRRWFISRELELFKLRWSYLNSSAKQSFLKLNCLNFSPLDGETVNFLNSISGGFIKTVGDYYCVKWMDVIDLVRSRKVYLERGKAYISSDDLISVLGAIFRSNLSHTLVMISHRLPILQEDERLKRLMKNLHHAYTGKNYVCNGSNKCVSVQSLDSLSKTSFPLCMKQMYSALKNDHHLKHNARQQFGLFLKGIGLSLEDALTFWRTEFTKKIDLDQFEKKYAYGIRYNYGKEGKKTNYTPYSCVKIISSSPGPGEYHGCPFKHNDIQSLKQTFISQNFTNQEINEILHYVSINQYQLACSKYFELSHKTSLLTTITHPNQYFEEVQKLFSRGTTEISSTNKIPKTVNYENNPPKMEEFLNESDFDKMDFTDIDNISK